MKNLAIRSALQEGGKGWRIISLVRDPLARNLSAFFENLDVYVGRNPQRRLAEHPDPMQHLYRIFVNEFDHDRPLRWFEHELKGILALDIFRAGFDREKGETAYESGGHKVLILRMEDFQRSLPSALERFLTLPGLQIVNANVGEHKWYSSYYREMKANAQFPRELVDAAYDSVYVRTFYSETEIAVMRSRWIGHGA